MYDHQTMTDDDFDTDVPEPDRDLPPDELLDWACWYFATQAENFYPPRETAQRCIDSFEDSDRLDVDERTRGIEFGQHQRAVDEVVSFYETLERYGYNPRQRAEREIERCRNKGWDIPSVDWTWYDDHDRLGPDDADDT